MRAKAAKKVLIALFWVLLWEAIALAVNNSIILPRPDRVLIALFNCALEPEFWLGAGLSALRIAIGFLIGAVLGVIAAVISKASPIVRDFLAPVIGAAKSVPVAAFIILVLIWAGSGLVSLVVSAIITFPVLAVNTLAGLDSVDKRMLEVAEVFRMKPSARVRAIYIPAIYSNLAAAFELGAGMAVRAGVAAEVIGQPLASLGNELYRAKIFLDTERVIAVAIVTVALGWAFSALAGEIIRRAFGEWDA
ncbi:MAG: ABC transporter permease subunit [Oscillospiraceae bacterium]|nr:ABC transporter permease subunit [Oscillospiraceae bacterium]